MSSKISGWILGGLLFCASSTQAATITFEDQGLAPNSESHQTPFVSGGASFNNTYTDYGGGFYSWEGWSLSSKTDTTTPGYGNQYSAITGGGSSGSQSYGVAFGSTARIVLPAGTMPVSIDLTNTTYAYRSMLNGDSFAKKFGGSAGTDPDFFRVTIGGLNGLGQVIGTPIEVYLGDYRAANNALDFLVNTWQNISLLPLSGASTLTFAFASSDNGQFGMNTPAYFAADNLVVAAAVPEPGTLAFCGVALVGTAIIRYRRRRIL